MEVFRQTIFPDRDWGHFLPWWQGIFDGMMLPMITEIRDYIQQDTPQPTQAPTIEGIVNTDPLFTCNLGTRAIIAEEAHPPVPILSAFGNHPLHLCRATGRWDVSKAAENEATALMRSVRMYYPKQKEDNFDDFIFQFGPRSFLYGDVVRVNGCASTPEEAFQLVKVFTEKYTQPPSPDEWGFQLIKIEKDDIFCEWVPLEADSLMEKSVFDLHYPVGTDAWHQEYEEKLKSKKKGLSILEGTPGTGKTSYLRHLIGRLRETHRFYFIPPASMGMLSNSKFIGFWAGQKKRYPEKKLAVILEDADAVLMIRGSDNRDEVSALLNLSDGMLGDFLSLHIICTINCKVSDIDQALLRPGRLICLKRFERLNSEQALKLANHIGKSLPEKRDYSLAEVFSGEEQACVSRPRMGFGG
jgi:hypothetical protein